MEQTGIGDIRLIILGVARRPTACAASTSGAAAGLVGLGLHTTSASKDKCLTIIGAGHQRTTGIKGRIVTVGTYEGDAGAIFNTKHLIFGIPQIGVLCDFCFILISYIFDVFCKC